MATSTAWGKATAALILFISFISGLQQVSPADADEKVFSAGAYPTQVGGHGGVLSGRANDVNCSALFPGVSSGCCHAIASNASSGLPASRRPLARMAYASGTSLPYDAGHYHTCTHTSGAAYFLLGWHINDKDIPVAELGLCLPASCAKVDVEALLGMHQHVSVEVVANHTRAVVANTERILNGFGLTYCADASRGGADHSAPAHCREYLVVMAALDAATALADETANGNGNNDWFVSGGGTINLIVTSPEEDRVGFIKGATSGWAACFFVLMLVLLVGVGVATGLDMVSQWQLPHTGNNAQRSGGELTESLIEQAQGEASSPTLAPISPWTGAASRWVFLNAIAERLNVLSLQRNLPKLFASPAQPGPVDCLNGMRVISMFWIIIGHTMMMPTPINGFDNPEDLIARWGARGSTWFQLVIGGQIAVDSFFYLSGFLIAFLGVKDLEKRGGKIPALGMIAHRYMRITPAFVATLIFYSEIASRVGNGPFFIRFQRSVFRRCDKLWLPELLYLHNFIPFDSDKVCMGWSWYLGNDFIFFLCATFILSLHHHRPRIMWLTMAGVALASFALTYWLVVRYDGGLYIFGDTYINYSFYAYSKPYCRIPAFLIGMMFGFLNQRWLSDDSSCRLRLSTTTAMSYISTAVVALLAVVFMPLSDYREAESWSPWANGLFLTFSRPLWATALGILTTVCALEGAPWLNGFLSSPIWTPLARLTFGAYLMHPVVIKWGAGTATASYHFSLRYMASSALFNTTCAYTLAAVLWLLVERPIMNVETRLMRAGRSPS